MKRITLLTTILILIFSHVAIGSEDLRHDWVDKPGSGCPGHSILKRGVPPTLPEGFSAPRGHRVLGYMACNTCGKQETSGGGPGTKCSAGMWYMCASCGMESPAKAGICKVKIDLLAALRK